MTKEYSDYLAHHGIKGQKWGIRRFQNEDGTLKNPKEQQVPGEKKVEPINNKNGSKEKSQIKRFADNAARWAMGAALGYVALKTNPKARKLMKTAAQKTVNFIKNQRTLWFVRTGM